MITLLAKIFIKDSIGTDNERGAYGMLCGIVGIVLNLFLFVGKLTAGLVAGSIAIVADAFNNLSDAGSSIVTMLGFKIAAQKPDSEHPYGHGRMEYVAGFIVSALILATAITLIKDSFDKIIHPSETEFSVLVIVILAASILVKLYMFTYNRIIGKRIDSETVKATATDSISDTVATSVILAGLIASHYYGIQLDGYLGLLVGIMIGYAGVSSCRETIDPLLGKAPDKAFIEQIAHITLNFDPHVQGMHDLLVHDYGPGRRFISLHAEVPAEDNVLVLHDVIDNLEHKLQSELGCFATVHMDPIVTKDARVLELKEQVLRSLKQVIASATMHDFRVVFGDTHTNLIFDVLVPMDLKMTDSEVKTAVQEHISNNIGENYKAVVEVDRDYGGRE